MTAPKPPPLLPLTREVAEEVCRIAGRDPTEELNDGGAHSWPLWEEVLHRLDSYASPSPAPRAFSCRNTPTAGLPPCACKNKCDFDGMAAPAPDVPPLLTADDLRYIRVIVPDRGVEEKLAAIRSGRAVVVPAPDSQEKP